MCREQEHDGFKFDNVVLIIRFLKFRNNCLQLKMRELRQIDLKPLETMWCASPSGPR